MTDKWLIDPELLGVSSFLTSFVKVFAMHKNFFLCSLAKKLPKNEGTGTQGSGQGRRLVENEQSRQSTNCCKWCSSSKQINIFIFIQLKSQI